MNQPPANKDTSARSPFAGCAILIAALAVMVFLIGFSILTLFRQFNEIAKFTGTKPVPIEISTLENQEPKLNQFAEKVEKFRQDLSGESEASLALTPEDLNLAIAAFDSFKELKGTLQVTSIEGDTIHAAISFTLNGKPRFTEEGETGWITSDSRYLNGTLIARPHLLKKEIVLAIDKIDVPGAKVPQEFIDQMSPYRITERYLKDPDIGPVMAKLTHVGIQDGKIVLTRMPNEIPADMITDKQVDAASTRLFTALGVAASVFLAITGLIVVIGLRSKAKKAANSSK